MAPRKTKSSYKEDDGPTIPDAGASGVPRAPLDLDTEPVALGDPNPPMPLDTIWTQYEAGLRALGKMSTSRAPRELEDDVARRVAVLGAFLRKAATASASEREGAADNARAVRLAIARAETWLARR